MDGHFSLLCSSMSTRFAADNDRINRGPLYFRPCAGILRGAAGRDRVIDARSDANYASEDYDGPAASGIDEYSRIAASRSRNTSSRDFGRFRPGVALLVCTVANKIAPLYVLGLDLYKADHLWISCLMFSAAFRI